MADFPTTEDLKAYINDKTATMNHPFVEAARAAAIAQLNNDCQRTFVVAGSASARLYAPSSYEIVRIHDCTSVTLVTNDGNTIGSSLYQLEPVNAMSWTGEAVPYEQIRMIGSTAWEYGTNNLKQATVSVTATWGWSSIPYPIIEACKIITKDIVMNRNSFGFGLAAITEQAGITARTNPFVASAINTYRRVEAFGIA